MKSCAASRLKHRTNTRRISASDSSLQVGNHDGDSPWVMSSSRVLCFGIGEERLLAETALSLFFFGIFLVGLLIVLFHQNLNYLVAEYFF